MKALMGGRNWRGACQTLVLPVQWYQMLQHSRRNHNLPSTVAAGTDLTVRYLIDSVFSKLSVPRMQYFDELPITCFAITISAAIASLWGVVHPGCLAIGPAN